MRDRCLANDATTAQHNSVAALRCHIITSECTRLPVVARAEAEIGAESLREVRWAPLGPLKLEVPFNLE